MFILTHFKKIKIKKDQKIEIKIGDKVYLSNENRRKLDAFYIGPYLVTQVDNQNCEIRNEITNNSMIVHKNRLIT